VAALVFDFLTLFGLDGLFSESLGEEARLAAGLPVEMILK